MLKTFLTFALSISSLLLFGQLYEYNNNVGIGHPTPFYKFTIKKDYSYINFMTGTNSSGYELNVGLNDDGINFESKSHLRGFNFKNPNGTLLKITSNGNIGVGTSSPESKFHIKSGAQNITFLKCPDGNCSSEYDLDISTTDAGINFVSSSIVRGFNFKNPYGTHLSIDRWGNVIIGGTTPKSGYKLSVDGKAVFEEVLVQLSQNWGDFVFDENYDLNSLEETESYIKENKHLPGIPSADSLDNQGGIELGEMQRLQMIKIEELTLHMIEINKEKKELAEENKTLIQSQVSLENKNKTLEEKQNLLEQENQEIKAELNRIEALLEEILDAKK